MRFHLASGGKSETAGGFGDHLHACREEPHAIHQLRVGDSQYVIHIALDYRKGVLAEVLGLCAVSDRFGSVDVNNGPGAE